MRSRAGAGAGVRPRRRNAWLYAQSDVAVRLARLAGSPVDARRFAELLGAPEVDDADAHLGQEPPGQRQAEPDHAGEVAVDAFDEPAAQTVQSEATGHMERFSGGDVGVDLRRTRRAEADRRDVRARGFLRAHSAVEPDDGVAGEKLAGASGHRGPALAGRLGRARLADHLAVYREHRIARNDHGGGA